LGNGSGWTSEGLDAYNKIHELVKEDRLKNGDQFNRELTKAITERHNKRKSAKDSNTQVTPPKRKKPIPVMTWMKCMVVYLMQTQLKRLNQS
jgi:hypothetical protein